MDQRISLAISGVKSLRSGYRPLIIIGNGATPASEPQYLTGMDEASGYYGIRCAVDECTFFYMANPSAILTEDGLHHAKLRIALSIPPGTRFLEGQVPVSPYVILEKIRNHFIFYNMTPEAGGKAYRFKGEADDQIPFEALIDKYTLGPLALRYVEMKGDKDAFLPLNSREEYQMLFSDPGYPEFSSIRSLVISTKGAPSIPKVHLSIPREIAYKVMVNGKEAGTVVSDNDKFTFPKTPSALKPHFYLPGFEFVLGDVKIGIVPPGVDLTFNEMEEIIECRVGSYPEVNRRTFHLFFNKEQGLLDADSVRGRFYLHCEALSRDKTLDENGEVDFIGDELDGQWTLSFYGSEDWLLSYDKDRPLLGSMSLGDFGSDINVFITETSDVPQSVWEEEDRKKREKLEKEEEERRKEGQAKKKASAKKQEGEEQQAPQVVYTITVNGRPIGRAVRPTDKIVYLSEPTPLKAHYMNRGFEMTLSDALSGKCPEGVEVEIDKGRNIIECKVPSTPQTKSIEFSLVFNGIGIEEPDFHFEHYFLLCLENGDMRALGERGKVEFVGEEIDRTWKLIYDIPNRYCLSVSAERPVFPSFIPDRFEERMTIFITPFIRTAKPIPPPPSTPINNRGNFWIKPYSVFVNDVQMGSVANGSDTFIYPETPCENDERMYYPSFQFVYGDVKRGKVPSDFRLQMDDQKREIRCYVSPVPRVYTFELSLIYNDDVQRDQADCEDVYLECVEKSIQKQVPQSGTVEFYGDELDRTWRLDYRGWKDCTLSFDRNNPALCVLCFAQVDGEVNVCFFRKQAEIVQLHSSSASARDNLPFGFTVKIQGRGDEQDGQANGLDGLSLKVALISKSGRIFRDEVPLFKEEDPDPEASHRHTLWYTTEFIPLSSPWRTDPPSKINLASQTVYFKARNLLSQTFESGTKNSIKFASDMYTFTPPEPEKQRKSGKEILRGILRFLAYTALAIVVIRLIWEFLL